MNLYGQDMDDIVFLFDVGFVWIVDFVVLCDFVGCVVFEVNGMCVVFVGLILQKENGKVGGVLCVYQKVVMLYGEGEIMSGMFLLLMQELIVFVWVLVVVQIGDIVQV